MRTSLLSGRNPAEPGALRALAPQRGLTARGGPNYVFDVNSQVTSADRFLIDSSALFSRSPVTTRWREQHTDRAK